VNVATRWIGLLMLALTGVASAQGLPSLDPDGLALPPEAMAPGGPGEELPSMTNAPSDGAPSVLAGPPQVALEGQPIDAACDANQPYDIWNSEPAVPISSGTWLDRGIWYASGDAVMTGRVWSRRDRFMASQDQNVNQIGFFRPLILGGGGGPSQLTTSRNIFLKRAHPGEDAAARVTLGKFLFRDDDNRDHALEFTAESGGDWSQDIVMTSATPNNLYVPIIIDGGNRSFDNNATNLNGQGQTVNTPNTGSSRQEVKYTNHFSNFELNYHVKQRLGRDQMVMDPNGGWRREASNGFTKDYSFGLRFMNLADFFDWTAQNIAANTAANLNDPTPFPAGDGRYLIRTQNNVFGPQLGAGLGYETGRWIMGVESKVGLLVNDVSSHNQLDFTADDTGDFNLKFHEDQISFLGQTDIFGRWHLTPNLSVRGGLEVLLVTSQAVAPEQANFVPTNARLDTRNAPYYLGGSVGIEGYW
jgi:hypothetical protein